MLFDLIDELNKKGLIKKLNKKEIKEIRERIETILRNFDEVKDLYGMLIELVGSSSSYAGGSGISLKDGSGKEYTISMKQILTVMGLTYGALCEVIKYFLSEVIQFEHKPSGLGSLVKKLERMHVSNLGFFDDLDWKVRNAFFHLDFHIKEGKIYCTNRTEKKYLCIKDLFRYIHNADLSAYVVMNVCEYIFMKTSM